MITNVRAPLPVAVCRCLLFEHVVCNLRSVVDFSHINNNIKSCSQITTPTNELKKKWYVFFDPSTTKLPQLRCQASGTSRSAVDQRDLPQRPSRGARHSRDSRVVIIWHNGRLEPIRVTISHHLVDTVLMHVTLQMICRAKFADPTTGPTTADAAKPHPRFA